MQKAALKQDLDDDDDDDDDDGGGQSPGAAGSAVDDAPKEASISKSPATVEKKGVKKLSKKATAAAAATSSAIGSGGVDATLNRCTVTVTLPLHSPKLLMLEIVERVAAATMVRSTPGIDKVGWDEGRGNMDRHRKGT